MSNTISPKFSPKESRPSRSSHKPNRGKRAACAAPFASEPREWHLDLIRQRASICTELAELAPHFHGTKFSTLPGSQLGDPKSCNEDGQEARGLESIRPGAELSPRGLRSLSFATDDAKQIMLLLRGYLGAWRGVFLGFIYLIFLNT